MKLSMKSRYGLRALIDLSVNSKNEQVALGGIAERNNISPQYLEQVPEDCDYKAAPEAIQKLVIDKVNYELEKILTGITLYDLEKEYQTYVDYGQDMYYI